MTITTFVFVMMLWVDYVNVYSRGNLSRVLAGRHGRQYLVSSLLGATPGCLGAFMNVSFYVHGFISFGAIVAGMIATSGDEAFVMLAMFPREAILLPVILFVVGVATGWLVDHVHGGLWFVSKDRCEIAQFHELTECRCFSRRQLVKDLRHLSLARFALILLLAFVLYGFVFGLVGSPTWDWQRVTFTILTSSAFFIVLTVPEHYLDEHIWNHIAKHHMWRVALWTFGALALVRLGVSNWPLGVLRTSGEDPNQLPAS